MTVPYASRYGEAAELREMESFSSALVEAGLHIWVAELFYDSKSSCCAVTLDPTISRGDPIVESIIKLGEQSLAQFEVFGCVYHGEPLQAWFDSLAFEDEEPIPEFPPHLTWEGIAAKINAGDQLPSRTQTIEEKGRIGEQALNGWFQREGLGYVAICQSPESFAPMFKADVKRPDFLMLIEGVGLLAVDAKNYRQWNGQFTLNISNELRQSVAFERLFRIPLWYAYRDCESSDPAWYWISALKIVEVGVRRGQSNNQFLSIDLRHFERIEIAADLAKLYSHRLPGARAISRLPLKT